MRIDIRVGRKGTAAEKALKHNLYLLDIDSVLIDPGGYRESFSHTINYFMRAMGWKDSNSHQSAAQVFEAHGIINEWDMCAICLSGLFVAVAGNIPDLPFSNSVLDALNIVKTSGIPRQEVNFSQLAREVAIDIKPSETHLPALAASRVFDSIIRSTCDPKIHDPIRMLIDHILSNARDIEKSRTMSTFQNYALGSANFVKTYSMPSSFETSSLIVEHDVPILSSSNCENLLFASVKKEIRPVIFTARPSLAPRGVHDEAHYYSPEAELAVELVGLESIPMIGSGRTEWLAWETGDDPNSFIKPALIHALAAIGTAISEDEVSGLMAADMFLKKGVLSGPLSDLVGKELFVTVFEDSARSIESVSEALVLLREFGVESSLCAKGIAVDHEKRRLLSAAGATLFDDINVALTN